MIAIGSIYHLNFKINVGHKISISTENNTTTKKVAYLNLTVVGCTMMATGNS